MVAEDAAAPSTTMSGQLQQQQQAESCVAGTPVKAEQAGEQGQGQGS